MLTCMLLFTFSHKCHLISLENKYSDLHSGIKLKSNLLYCCFIANTIRVTDSIRDISSIRFGTVSLLCCRNNHNKKAKSLFFRKAKKKIT